jgi:hypothetical protein
MDRTAVSTQFQLTFKLLSLSALMGNKARNLRALRDGHDPVLSARWPCRLHVGSAEPVPVRGLRQVLVGLFKVDIERWKECPGRHDGGSGTGLESALLFRVVFVISHYRLRTGQVATVIIALEYQFAVPANRALRAGVAQEGPHSGDALPESVSGEH